MYIRICVCVYVCVYIYMYVGLRFKSNPVLTLPHVPVRSKGKQCQEYCRPIDFIFFLPLSREDHRLLRFYPAPLLSRDIQRYHHSGIPFSFARRLDSSYYVTAFVSRARFSPGDEIFDLRFVTLPPPPSPFIFLFPFPASHSLENET